MVSPPETGGNDGQETAHAAVQRVIAEFYPLISPNHPNPNGVIHCFSGAWEDAQAYVSRGFMIGVDGPVTYPNSKALQDVVARLPLKRLVLETDSPYLPPQTQRGRRNEPSYIPIMAEAIASLKRLTPEEIGRQTTANAKALYRLC